MSSFKGTYTYSIDKKGRVNLPVKLRKYVSPDANDTFVVTRGYDRCLFVFPLDEWNKQEQSIRSLSSSDPKHRFFMRLLLQHATESQLDGQSRITIPKELTELAGIEGEVRIIGMLDHVELWDPGIYKEYLKTQPETYENVAQVVFEGKQ